MEQISKDFTSASMPENLASRIALVNQTYSYTNNVGFYAVANGMYYDYYSRVIRRCSQWLDGYVYDFHDVERGWFSTRLCSSLVNGIGNHIVGQRIFFEKASSNNDNSSIDFLNKWQKSSNFQDSCRNGIKMAYGLGTSLLKLNKSSKDLWLEDVRLDYFFFESDAKGKLTDVTTMIKGYYNVNHREKEIEQKNYYLVEHRYFRPIKDKRFKEENGKTIWFNKVVGREPVVEYSVYEYMGNSMTAQTFTPKGSNKMRFDSLPKQVKDSLRNNYDIYDLDVPQKLPFNDYLGCELLKNDKKDITLPNSPFGKPVIMDIMAYLMAYDIAFSYMMRDLYLGKGIVFMPKFMTAPGQQAPVDNVFNGNDSAYFEQIPSLDPDKQKPFNIQFDLRSEQWQLTLDNILRKIATTIGMSPKTIASYLEDKGSTRKTATEVNAEDDATISYINIKRSIFAEPINRIIEAVLNFYGLPCNAVVKFATPSLVNIDKIVDRVQKLMQVGLLTTKMALRLIFPDDDEDQINAKVIEIEEYNRKKEAEKQQQLQVEKDSNENVVENNDL